MGWAEVEAALPEAKSIAFDGCHKIYILLDDEQVAEMDACGYGQDGSFHIRRDVFPTQGAMLVKLSEWFTQSCGLRFIDSVRTVTGDPNLGFEALIGQGEFDDSEYADDDEDAL